MLFLWYFGCVCLLAHVSHSLFACVKQKNQAMEDKLSTPREWIKAALIAHNKHRAQHGAGPLTINDTLCRSAQWTANTNLKKGMMVHTSKMTEGYDMSCGENLFSAVGKNSLRSGNDPVDSWYSEEVDYDYETGKTKVLSRAVGHFTQLVWADTKEVCIAYAVKKKEFFVAAHYYPRGNAKKLYTQKVGLKRNVTLDEALKKSQNPWVEMLCKLAPSKSYTKRYKCHYKRITQPYKESSKSYALAKKDSKKLMDRLLKVDPISTYIEAPLGKLGIKMQFLKTKE